MQLSERLTAVANFVTPQNRVADIGCDHAYTSIYLIENKLSSKVIAMDVNQGPVDRARENVKKYGYEDQIEVRKSNGLEKLNHDEVDTILIAGMGGPLMIQILTEHIDILLNMKELILQPQSEPQSVRKMITDHGFVIIDENMLKEEGKYYVMLKAEADFSVMGKDQYTLEKDEHYLYGRRLLEKRNSVLYEFLMKELRAYETLLQKLQCEITENTVLRGREIEQRIQLINNGLKYYEATNKQ